MPNEVVQSAAGGELTLTPEQVKAAEALGAAAPVASDVLRARAIEAEQRRQLDTATDTLIALGEGAVDAATLGVAHLHGPEAEMRRQVHSGAEFAGSVLGTIVGLKVPGPFKWVTEAGEGLGRTAAREVLGTGPTLARGLGEAGAGAAVMGTWSAGHQAMDAIVEDKPFSGEAVLDQMKMGGLLGFGSGLALEGLSALGARRGVSRAAVEGQGGLVGAEVGPLKLAYQDTLRDWDGALGEHEARLGAIREMREAGVLNAYADDFMVEREAAIKEARVAQRRLAKLDPEMDARLDAEPKEYARYQAARDDFLKAVDRVEDVMRPRNLEINAQGTMSDQEFYRGNQAPGEKVTPSSEAQTNPGRGQRGDLDKLNQVVEQLPVRQPETPNALSMEAPPAKTLREDLPLGAAEGAMARAAEKAPTEVWERPKSPAQADQVNRARNLLQEWQARGRRPSPGARAQARAQDLLNDLQVASGGRLDSAATLRFADRDRIAPSHEPMGGRMDQVWALRRAAKMMVDETRGVQTGLRRGLWDELKQDVGAGLLGYALKSPMMAFAARLFGVGGRIAAISGRLAIRVAETASKFLTTTRVRAVSYAAQNKAYAYSDRGPIKDPLERIEEIKRVSQDSEALNAKVLQSSGDLAAMHPEWVQALSLTMQVQLAALAAAAPKLAYDATGKPMQPAAGDMRRFLEFENAVHDLDGVLKAVASGHVTTSQIAALQMVWPEVHKRLVSQLLSNPEVIQSLHRGQLRALQMITGIPLNPSASPDFNLRQAQAWIPAAPPQPGTPQAFSINKQQVLPGTVKYNPEGASLPSQSGSGRAPGN